MTFSDAIPVQFWLIDCDTYNEEERYGLNHRCFCLPFECDDIVKIQFQDDPNLNLNLLIYDDEFSLLDSIPIEETEAGVYLTSFTPSDNTPDFCDKKIQLQIRKEAGNQGISMPAFTLWGNQDVTPGNIPWTLGANPNVALTNVGDSSELLWVDYPFISGATYNIVIHYTLNSGGALNQSDVTVRDDSFNVIFSNGIDVIGGGSTETEPLIFTATEQCTKLAIRISGGGVSFPQCNITLNSITATESLGTPEIVAKSDCISVKSEHEGTILIEYSNHRNYAGIINNNGSPDLTFYLRIPAVFNEERFPETDEPMQLSNNRIISLNSQVKKQRLLETDQMPNYMHLKVKEVLKHQFVTISDVDYVKEEPYEQVENTNKRWPMRRYTCWLTEKEYVVRNIL